MNDINVSFMSALRHNMNIDLQLVKNYLVQEIDEISFRYYISNGKTGNSMAKSGLHDREVNFAEKMQHAICIDSSIPMETAFKNSAGQRIMIALPFENQFKDLAAQQENPNNWIKPNLSQFTHIFAATPLGNKLLRETYEIGSAKIIDDIPSPYVWDIAQNEKQEQVRAKFETCYPGMKGKKVLAILTAGNAKKETENLFAEMDLKKVLRQLGEDWFIITNNTSVLESFAKLSFNYIQSVGYIESILPARDAIYFAEALLTNSSIYAYYFAAKKKPMYIVKYADNNFEKFIDKNYPGMFIENTLKLLEINVHEKDFTETQVQFYNDFVIEPKKNPYAEIKKILLNRIDEV